MHKSHKKCIITKIAELSYTGKLIIQKYKNKTDPTYFLTHRGMSVGPVLRGGTSCDLTCKYNTNTITVCKHMKWGVNRLPFRNLCLLLWSKALNFLHRFVSKTMASPLVRRPRLNCSPVRLSCLLTLRGLPYQICVSSQLPEQPDILWGQGASVPVHAGQIPTSQHLN